MNTPIMDLRLGYSKEFNLSVLERSFVLPKDLNALSAFLEGKEEGYSLLNFLNQWYDPTEYIYQFTSGSTAKPKKIALEKRKMILSAQRTLDYFKIQPNSRFLLCLHFDYIAAKMQLIRALVSGGEAVVVFPRANPMDFISGLIDFAAMVPLQLESSKKEMHRLKTVLLGGVGIKTDLRLPYGCLTEIYEGFGMTESYTHIAIRSLYPITESVFKAMPKVFIDADENQALIVKDAYLDLTLQTRDKILLHSESQFEYVGRLDWVINSGGVKIQSEEVEAILQKHINKHLFVAGKPDAVLGEKLVLIIESSEKSADSFESMLKKIDEFKPYHRPKEIYVLPEFVRSNSQKLLRAETLRLIDGF